MASRFLGTSRFKNQFFQPSWEGTRFCEGVGVVKRVHSLSGGVNRFATALKEVEEVREEGEGNGGLKVEEKRLSHAWMR